MLLGIISAATFSLKIKLLSKIDYLKIKNHFIKYNLPDHIGSYFSKKNLQKLILFMKKDKKNTSNLINLILLKKIGAPIIDRNYHKENLKSFLRNELTN